jgi:hypothetical protein
MVLAIFVGGIILGFSLGFATMAAMASREGRGQSEGVEEMGNNLTRSYSSTRDPVRALGTPAILLTPWL